jgi:xenotropic and polytropic retrovirus receptor 1
MNIALQISNVMIRFIWVWYLVPGPLNAATRGFIFACLEILRRVQWNFRQSLLFPCLGRELDSLILSRPFTVRLENEHLGNADQYRVTREVPLPYSFDDAHDSEEEEMAPTKGGGRKILRKRSVRMSTVSVATSTGSQQ